MAKRKSFEKILNTEFRWPKIGDLPFVMAADPLSNASIANDSSARLLAMTDGYRRAADLLVKQAESNDADRDFLVYPIIFNYRHFLELSLKYLLATHGPRVGIEPNWKTHDLLVLWEEFYDMLQRFGTNDPDEVDPIVASTVLEFAKIDPGSYSHRYPVDCFGKPLPVTHADLHLATLADVINGVSGYFSGTDGFLSDLVNP